MTEPAAPAPEPPVRVGELLDGKYRVERILGMGGMGVVVAAMHEELGERRAVKFMLPHVLGDAQAVERFQREARAAARLKSEHVVKVFDVGRLPSGAPYIVMEHLVGTDLLSLFQERGRLPVGEAVTYVLQACEAIAEAHAAGIIHRDIKPANLFLTALPDGWGPVKVLDFGISKLVGSSFGDDGGDLTATTAMFGSPSYMSPEQIRSSKLVDARTDVWSMGVMLYQLVTGELPFVGADRLGLCMAVVQNQPRRPTEIRPELPAAVDTVCLRCLSKELEGRYSNMTELAQALLPLAATPDNEVLVRRLERRSGVPHGTAAPTRSSATAAEAQSGRTDGSWGRTGRSERAEAKRSYKLVGALTVAMVVGGLASVALFGLWREPAEPSRAAPLAAPTDPEPPKTISPITVESGGAAPDLDSPISTPPAGAPSAAAAELPSSSASASSEATPAAPPPHKRPVSAAAPPPTPAPPPVPPPPPPKDDDPFGRSRK